MGRSLRKPNPDNVYIDRGLRATTQKTKFLEFQDYMLERACHMDWTFFVFGKRNGEMPNIPWLEFFHFQLLQILVPRFTSFGWKFRHIFFLRPTYFGDAKHLAKFP